jgi:hypothetical protein
VTRAGRELPDLLLGVTSLDLPSRTTRDRMLEVAGRFREPESLAVTLVKALDAGAQAVYAVPSRRLRAALRELRRAVPVLARLPLTPPAGDLSYEHALLVPAPDGEPGTPGGVLRAAATSLAMFPGSFTDDLAARVAARCAREAPALGTRVWAGIAVSAPVTDLALAAGNARFFERMTRFGRARFGGLAGFETNNLGLLLSRLHAWGIAADFVLGAVNPRGFAMKPDRATVLAQMAASGIPVIASELRAGGTVPLAEGARYALEGGARGLVADLVDMDDVAGELRSLGR